MKFIAVFIFVFSCAAGALACSVEISTLNVDAIYGVVTDQKKTSISGANIKIYKTADSKKALAETVSDENGRFEIEDFPAGEYIIRAWAEKFAVTTAYLKLKRSTSNVKDAEMVFTLVGEEKCTGRAGVRKIKKSK
jgi:hypothetical protein